MGADTFTYSVSDGIAPSNDATVTITVHHEIATQTVGAGGGSVTTGTSATPTDLVETSVTTPIAGDVKIVEGPISGTNPAPGHTYLGQQVNTTISTITDENPLIDPANPLVMTFTLDLSQVASGQNEDTIQIFRNGVLVPNCPGGTLTALDYPCVFSRTLLPDGDLQFTVKTLAPSQWDFGALIAGNGNVSTLEDTALNGSVATFSGHPSPGTLTFAKVTDPAHGALVVNTNGSFTYTPAANYNGADSFTYSAADGLGGVGQGTVSITVTPGNDAPSAPTNLVTSTPAVGRVDLTWTDTSTNETGFDIAQTDSLAVVRTVGANVTSASFTGLDSGTSYHWYVRACNAGECSGWFGPVGQTPSGPLAQTIAFGALAGKIYGDAPFDVSATASSGLPVSFSIVSGPATIAGNTVTITGAGTVVVRASQGGNAIYAAAANVEQSLTVGVAGQTITFGALTNKTYGDAPFNVTATASSGLPVSFSIVSGPATIAGNTVTITGGGTVVVRASQAGTGNYGPAPNVNQSFTVSVAAQTITFGALANKTYGDAPFNVSATASSGLTVSFSIVSGPATIAGNTVTITGAGTVVVRASQAGNANYGPAPNVNQSFTIGMAAQTITFGALTNKTYGDAPFTVSATASSGLPVSFSIVSGPATIAGNTVTIIGVGTVVVRASQAGNANYNAATAVDQSFMVGATTQTITFGALTNKTYGDAPFTVTATASSGLPVSFSIVSGPATIAGNTVTITGGARWSCGHRRPAMRNYGAGGRTSTSRSRSPRRRRPSPSARSPTRRSAMRRLP